LGTHPEIQVGGQFAASFFGDDDQAIGNTLPIDDLFVDSGAFTDELGQFRSRLGEGFLNRAYFRRYAGAGILRSTHFITEFQKYDYNDYGDLLNRRMQMGTQKWTVAEAKAKFSEVIERAASEGPQTITRNGHEAAVVVGTEEWRRKTKRVGTLVEFFANSPLRGSGLKLRRIKDRPRKIDL